MEARIKQVPQSASMPRERRSGRRKLVLEGGQIISDMVAIDCIIRDVSESGARLRLPSSTVVPHAFLLLIKEANVVVPVVRVWRNAYEIGVKFTGEPRTAFC